MNFAKQAFWLSCMLVILVCSGWYFTKETSNFKLDGKNLSQSADIIISNLTLRRFDETGKLINCLQSPKIQHIPENDTHLIELPHLTFVQANQPAWEIRAKQATAIHGGEQITLSHEVIVHQNQTPHSQESLMKTEELIYFPKDQLAMTEQAVSFEQPGTIVHAQGMKAYFADKRIQLLSKARATYEPKQA